ncbi:MAG: ribonuclease Z [Methanobacterium sp.]|nr:ribonuclease Z [Methanobacterium sp.]
MELIFLGTSSAIPTNHRNHSSIALKSFGEIMLFDCGEGTQRQMTRARLSPMKVNKIFLTHFHGDHILGVPGIIQSMAFRGRTEPLHIYGPPGLSEFVKYIKNFGYFALSFDIVENIISNGIVVDEEEYNVMCCKTEHSVTNFSYSINEKRSPKFLKENAIKLGVKPGPDFGKLQNGIPVKVGEKIIKPEQVLGEKRNGRKIIYSGDTRPCDKMIKFSANANILIHESTFNDSHTDKFYETGHSTASMAAEIAKKANVAKLILTHISTRYKDNRTIEKEARKIFENSIVAEDMMVVEVKNEH